MDPSTVNTLITIIGGGVFVGGGGWIFRNLLKNKDDQLVKQEKAHAGQLIESRKELDRKTQECEQERERADEAEKKYVQVLLADIEERKARDRTIELLSRAASRNNRSPFDEE